MAFKRRKKREKRRRRINFNFNLDELEPETKKGIFSVFLFASAAICLLSFFGLAGNAGNFINDLLKTIFGWGYFIVPILFLILGYLIINYEKYEIRFLNYLGIFLFIISFAGLLHVNFDLSQAIYIISEERGGGYLGLVISYPLQKIMGFWASAVVLSAIFLTSLFLMFNTPITWIKDRLDSILFVFEKSKGLFSRSGDEAEDEEEEDDDYEEEEENEKEPEFKKRKVLLGTKDKKAVLTSKEPKEDKEEMEIIPTRKFRRKIEIPINLLSSKKSKPTSGDIKSNTFIIKKTLENFNIPVEMGEVSVGPTVTQFTLKPSEGIKLNKITSLNNDLSLALAAHPIRIEAPIPGKSLIGIEVPNKGTAIVNFREIIESKNFKNRKSNLAIALGGDVSGKAWAVELDKMPHLLVAGATGSGKSVCLNSIIISLLYQNSPETLKLILVDPKRVELTGYNNIPYLLTPVITDVKKTVNALKWLIGEMDRRYDKLSKVGKRNISIYNQTAEEKMPYIVVIIDELADLMVAASSEIESCVVRLAQMARAVGIHLVLATQRPSVDIITGLIKANITSRIAFSVPALMDSRTILDCSGAEKLLGRGDMLYTSADLSKPVRLQGTFLSDNDIRDVVRFIKNNFDEPEFDEGVVAKQAVSTSFDFDSSGDDDELLGDAKELIVNSGRASASYLQRKFKIGYARAARLLDLLEEQGIIGPSQGAKPREILVTELYEEDYPDEEDEEESVGEEEYEEDEEEEHEEDEHEEDEEEEQESEEEEEE